MTSRAASGLQGESAEAPREVRRPFPALDPEPARRPVPARLLLAVAAVAAATAVVVWLVSPGASRRTATPLPSVPLPGSVIVLQPDGVLAAADPDGRITRTFTGLGKFERYLPGASPDRRYLVLPSGQVLRAGPGGLTPSGPGVSRFMGTYSSIPSVGAFADADRDVVIRGGNGYPGQHAQTPVTLAPLGPGSPVPLGDAQSAAGDPLQPGAFVTVASTAPVASSSPVLFAPDLRVERRDAGRPAMVLATTAQLLADVGAPTGQLSLLYIYPSPRGDTVAVEVAPDRPESSNAGLVVLSRSGRVLGSVDAGIGPTVAASPAWSPDGRSLAYVSAGSQGAELTMWTPGGSTTTWSLPTVAAPAGFCVWAPDGGGVLFSTSQGLVAGSATVRPVWTVVLRHGASTVFSGPGYPLLWSGSGA